MAIRVQPVQPEPLELMVQQVLRALMVQQVPQEQPLRLVLPVLKETQVMMVR
jgi:alpha-D-ribose 1-methylphosphonate 5-phosphate C-P lyase